jgi:hypothetical protein
MRFFKPLQVTLCAALLAVAFLPSLKADTWDKKTTVTFSEDVQVPGQVLPAGDYVFKLLNSPSNRNIVQIWNGDESQLITTVMTIPEQRPFAPDQPVFEFDESSGDVPQAVHAWFYPGDTTGFEFVYPSSQYAEPQ